VPFSFSVRVEQSNAIDGQIFKATALAAGIVRLAANGFAY